MNIKTQLRHFNDASAMTLLDISTRLDRKFKFLNKYVNPNDSLDFKIKKKNPRVTEENKLPKTVYEISIKGKLKTGEKFFFAKEAVDLEDGIDILASTVKSATTKMVKAKQEKPKGYKAIVEKRLEEDALLA